MLNVSDCKNDYTADLHLGKVDISSGLIMNGGVEYIESEWKIATEE